MDGGSFVGQRRFVCNLTYGHADDGDLHIKNLKIDLYYSSNEVSTIRWGYGRIYLR